MNLFKGIENFLESVDQQAAKRLVGEDDPQNPSSPSQSERNSQFAPPTKSTHGGPSNITSTSQRSVKMKSDDEIFAFLNTPSSQTQPTAAKKVINNPKRRPKSVVKQIKPKLEKSESKTIQNISSTKVFKSDEKNKDKSQESQNTNTAITDDSHQPEDLDNVSSAPPHSNETDRSENVSDEQIEISKSEHNSSQDHESDDVDNNTQTSPELETSTIQEDDLLQEQNDSEQESNIDIEQKNTDSQNEEETTQEIKEKEKSQELDESKENEEEEDEEEDFNNDDEDINDDDEEDINDDDEEDKGLQEEAAMLQNENGRLQMENKLMRSEVRTLNDEVTSLTSRSRAIQIQLDESNSSFHKLQLEMLEKDRQIARIKKSQEDFESSLALKDSTASSLRVKLQEEMHKNLTNQDVITKLTQRISVLESDHQSNIESNQETIQILNQKIDLLETQNHKEKEAFNKEKTEAQRREQALQGDLTEHSKTLANVQRLVEDKNVEKTKAIDKSKELELVCGRLRQEMSEYKERAKQVLEAKEKRIEDLIIKVHEKGNPGNNENIDLTMYDSQNNIKSEIEIESLKRRCEMLKEQLAESSIEVESLRLTVSEIQDQNEREKQESYENTQKLEDHIQKEKERVENLQFELLQRSQEVSQWRDKQSQNDATLIAKLNARNETISKLKSQLSMKQMSGMASHGQEELENRLKSVTDKLIQLQSQAETLSSEKTVLQMRLESEIERNKEMIRERYGSSGMGRKDTRDNSKIIDMDEEKGNSESGVRLRGIASLVPSSWSGDNPESKRHKVFVKTVKAVNFMDSASLRLGRIFQHNPLVRLCALLYLIVLHVWVLFLLSRPLEIHGLELTPPGVPPGGPV